ncbi:hypothetical protein [Cohnella caldifontis]|uniref:hypothetical protein n=1 Tax=Cohnella caldifontis TaxID=3027471 RepID=UPI0023ED10BB|nr:hypothetical protein [Cohnella sp. YIM B05605]
MKKLLFALIVLIVLAAGAAAAGLYYVRPDPMLNLDHGTVSLKDKAMDMAKRMSFDLRLSEEDVNDVLKAYLEEHPQRGPDVTVEGAQFGLSDDRMTADLRLLWKDRVPFGMRVVYRLEWRDPDLEAVVESVRVKDVSLPNDLVDSLSVPIGQELPELLKIKDVAFSGHEIIIRFRKPELSDLRKLLE